jgi:hypothetical protein
MVVEALACFLQQTAIEDATLIIFNQHPAPLTFDHPRVRVVNEVMPVTSLRHIRQRMHELAGPDVEYFHWWDDDDLYLPWHLEDCLTNIGDAPAWRPERSWLSERNTKFRAIRNAFEGSWIMRASTVRAARIDTHPTYLDHPVTLQLRDANLLKTTELGDFMSYIYRWDTDTQHLSGYQGLAEPHEQLANAASWRQNSNDVRDDGVLVPPDMSLRWQQFLDGVKDLVAPENHLELRRRLLGTVGGGRDRPMPHGLDEVRTG